MSKRTLNSIGRFLIIYGGLSAIMYFFGYNLVILMWVDLAGPIIGWILRGAMIVIGLVLILTTREDTDTKPAEEEKHGTGKQG